MSRPDSHRSVFVGAAWFAALLSLCVVALEPTLLERVRGHAAAEPPQRTAPQHPRVADRPEIAELRGSAPAWPQNAADDQHTGEVGSRLMAKPAPAGPVDRPVPNRAEPTPSGPFLPPPEIAAVSGSPRLPAPLRGLETLAELSVEIIAPVSAIQGEPAPFAIRVRNPTKSTAEAVTVLVSFDDCWELPGSDDLSVEQRLGVLGAGETRELTIDLRPLQTGTLTAGFRVTSGTHPPLTLMARAEVDPRLVDLEIAGPRRRSAGQRAEFVVTVQNSSDDDLPDARVDVEFDAAVLTVREASTGCVSGAGALAWPLGTLYRGERVQIQIEYECVAESLRSAIGSSFSTAGRVLRASGAHVEVVPSAALEVTIVDTDDPWTVGGPARFQITVSNRSSQPLFDLQLRVSASPHFKSLSAAVDGESSAAEVSGDAFGSLIRTPGLSPGGRIELVATATCVLPGNGALRVLAQSPELPAPFEVEETAVVNAPLADD